MQRIHDGRIVSVDIVDEWKACARANVAASFEARPRIRLRATKPFIVVAALIGAPGGPASAIAMVGLLASLLLVHELPRAVFARARGRGACVVLSARGGDTAVIGPPMRGADAVVFQMIGSATNAAVALAAFAGIRAGLGGAAALGEIALAHAVWGGVQALPLLPFRVGRAIAARTPPGLRLAHAALSLAVELFMAIGSLVVGTTLPWVLATVAAVASVAGVVEASGAWKDDRARVPAITGAIESLLSHGDARGASVRVKQALAAARSPAARSRLLTLAAWAAIGRQDPYLAHQAVGRLSPKQLDIHLVAAYLACCNRTGEAIALLEEGRRMGQRSRETTKLLVDLRFRGGDRQGALSLARQDRHLLSPGEWDALERALC